MRPPPFLRRAVVVLATAIPLPACNNPPAGPAPAPPAPPAHVVESDVVWPDPSTLDRAARATLAEKAAASVRASRVPVLLPAGKEWLAAAVVLSKPQWTSASMRQGDASVATTARRAAHVVPGIEPTRGNRPIRGTMGFVTQNERVWVVSWIENNVAYTTEVECAHESDVRCADDSFVIGLANGLVYVGGAFESGEKVGAP